MEIHKSLSLFVKIFKWTILSNCWLSHSLDWLTVVYHVDAVCRRLSRVLYFLRRLADCLTTSARRIRLILKKATCLTLGAGWLDYCKPLFKQNNINHLCRCSRKIGSVTPPKRKQGLFVVMRKELRITLLLHYSPI